MERSGFEKVEHEGHILPLPTPQPETDFSLERMEI